MTRGESSKRVVADPTSQVQEPIWGPYWVQRHGLVEGTGGTASEATEVMSTIARAYFKSHLDAEPKIKCKERQPRELEGISS